MISYRVEVDDLHELADRWRDFSSQWSRLSRDAVVGALMSGGFVGAVAIRVPKSEMARYASQLSGEITAKDGTIKRTRVTLTSKGTLPKNWRRKFGVNPVDADRVVTKYGHGALQRSLLPNGEKADPFEVKVERGSISFCISSSLNYARRMHETERPAEGDYWVPGLDFGWSTPRTGNHYLTKAWEDTYQRVERELGRNIDKIMRDMGLI